jgi:hypothetical protein
LDTQPIASTHHSIKEAIDMALRGPGSWAQGERNCAWRGRRYNVSMPVPQQEENNPNFDRSACDPTSA